MPCRSMVAKPRDNDGDGIGDNADNDDDNDGLPDYWEIAYGFDPACQQR